MLIKSPHFRTLHIRARNATPSKDIITDDSMRGSHCATVYGCVFACLLATWTVQAAVVGSVEETQQILDNVLEALSSGLAFLDSEHEVLNLDAIIGTRLVEGETHENDIEKSDLLLVSIF